MRKVFLLCLIAFCIVFLFPLKSLQGTPPSPTPYPGRIVLPEEPIKIGEDFIVSLFSDWQYGFYEPNYPIYYIIKIILFDYGDSKHNISKEFNYVSYINFDIQNNRYLKNHSHTIQIDVPSTWVCYTVGSLKVSLINIFTTIYFFDTVKQCWNGNFDYFEIRYHHELGFIIIDEIISSGGNWLGSYEDSL